jgi:predicted  nucleic acid-binding Zn-ribbon protein
VTDLNHQLVDQLAEVRLEVADLRDQLRTAKAQIDTLKADLTSARQEFARELVAHEETKEQVQTLLHEVRRLTEHTPPDGLPPVVGQ